MARRAGVARRARRRAALRARGSSANDDDDDDGDGEEDAFGAFGAYEDDDYEDDDGSVGFGGRTGASSGRAGSSSARAPSGFDDDTFLGVDMDEDLTASSSGRRGRDFGEVPSSSSMHPPEDIITEQEWLDGGDSWYDPVYKEVDAPRGSVLEKVQRMHLNEPGDFTFKDGEYFDLMGYVKAKTDNEFCLVLEVAERARERKIERLESYNSGSSSTLPPIQQVSSFYSSWFVFFSFPPSNFLAACFLSGDDENSIVEHRVANHADKHAPSISVAIRTRHQKGGGGNHRRPRRRRRRRRSFARSTTDEINFLFRLFRKIGHRRFGARD